MEEAKKLAEKTTLSQVLADAPKLEKIDVVSVCYFGFYCCVTGFIFFFFF